MFIPKATIGDQVDYLPLGSSQPSSPPARRVSNLAGGRHQPIKTRSTKGQGCKIQRAVKKMVFDCELFRLVVSRDELQQLLELEEEHEQQRQHEQQVIINIM